MARSAGSDKGGVWRDRAVVVIAALLLLAALEISAPVVLPLIFALFLAALFRPLQWRLAARLPRWLAVLTTLSVFLLLLTLFFASTWYAAEEVAERFPRYQQRAQDFIDLLRRLSQRYGVELASLELLRRPAALAGSWLVAALGGTVLTVALFVFVLLEGGAIWAALEQRWAAAKDRRRWQQVLRRICEDLQRYFVIRTGLGLLNGVAAAIACWLLGLDFAFTWGLLTYLLNYIPTLGSIVAVFPPALFALVQFEDLQSALLVGAVLAAIQLLLGNYVDPLVEGRYLRLSPLVVLFVVVFWGWLWGSAGAFIAVPLTVTVVIVCGQIASLRWIADLLSVGRRRRDL